MNALPVASHMYLTRLKWFSVVKTPEKFGPDIFWSLPFTYDERSRRLWGGWRVRTNSNIFRNFLWHLSRECRRQDKAITSPWTAVFLCTVINTPTRSLGLGGSQEKFQTVSGATFAEICVLTCSPSKEVHKMSGLQRMSESSSKSLQPL